MDIYQLIVKIIYQIYHLQILLECGKYLIFYRFLWHNHTLLFSIILGKKGYFHHEIDSYIPFEKMEEQYNKLDDSIKNKKKYKNEEKRSLAISDLYFHVSSLLPINCSKWVTSTTYDKDKEELWVYTKYVVPTGKDLNFVNKKETHEFNKNGKKIKKKVKYGIGFNVLLFKKIDENRTFKTGIFIMSLSKSKLIKKSVFTALLRNQMKTQYNELSMYIKRTPSHLDFSNIDDINKDEIYNGHVIYKQVKDLMKNFEKNEK